MADLKLTCRADGEVRILEVDGDVDVYTAPQLRETLIELTYHRHRYWIVVDLENATYIDSTGLGVLIGARKRAGRHGGQVALVTTGDRLLRVLRQTGLTKVFPVYDTADEAVAALKEEL